MRKRVIPVLLALVMLLVVAMPASAVTGGHEDGYLHPYGALLLVPGYTFCSGTLIDEDVVLTAAHCTFFWTEAEIEEVYITFDPYASVDPATWEITGGTWYRSTEWYSHPDYDDAAWPFTTDYGIAILEEEVVGITPAALPEPYLLDELLGDTGQSEYRFNDVGYGQSGVTLAQKPYVRNFDFIRKYTIQRYNPSQGAVGTLDPLWLTLQNVPNENFGSACGGDSGSGVFPDYRTELGDTVVAVHTGGYRMGYAGRLCGRMTSLNHRVDVPVALDWISSFVD